MSEKQKNYKEVIERLPTEAETNSQPLIDVAKLVIRMAGPDVELKEEAARGVNAFLTHAAIRMAKDIAGRYEATATPDITKDKRIFKEEWE